ncbi:UDP-N-acetylmuramoyl-L-alanyl-D-glutamate--2,6-diaminopimelate ligase, partial [Streptomyces sp. SID11233]|nr:UDP-N-acetylmuramoyl-L-alanyl-D-glutamate--2,6-diaminopimelate ligase [Streptomyces sp. SID11233]
AAIARALILAEPGDTVLVAGKGAETYQLVGDQALPFEDMAVVRELTDTAA